MMTEDQIKDVIRERLLIVNGSCNEIYIHHNDGLFRGLIWAMTGKDPGTYITADIASMLKKVGIYYEIKEDGLVHFW